MSEQKKTISDIVSRLRRGGKTLISSHVSPDGDSIGSQLAVYDLCVGCGCEPMIVNQDAAFPKYAFLNKHKLIHIYDRRKSYPRFDTAILLEAPELHRIGDVLEIVPDGCHIINIDHHPDNARYGHTDYVDERAEATGVMIYRLFQAAGAQLTSDNAEEIFTAILTDTGRFRFPNTTPEAMRLCAALLELGASPKKIGDALYACYRENQLRMLGELLATMELHHQGKTCVLVSDRPMREKYRDGSDEIEGLADYSIYTCGVEVGVVLREIEPKRTKVSLRSCSDFDVARVAKVHGGGGHHNASGCYLDKPVQEAKTVLLAQIARAMGE